MHTIHSINVIIVYFCLLQCFILTQKLTLGEVISQIRGGDISPNLKVCYQGEKRDKLRGREKGQLTPTRTIHERYMPVT